MKKENFSEQSFVTQEKVNKVVASLIQTYNPLYIYSFGSYAQNAHTIESDFDVMAIIDEYDDRPWKVVARGYQGFYGILMPVDLLVYDYNNFEKCKQDSTSFCYKILKTGKLLYERKKH